MNLEKNYNLNGYNSGDSSDDWPTYLLEHLATFSVSRGSVVYPADGMRKLLQMEKSSGIWTQKMLLKLKKGFILILDYENGDIVEKFPINLIKEPTAFISDKPTEIYNNILIFIVEQKNGDHLGDMHIFQCVGIAAQNVVEDMKCFLNGQSFKVKVHTGKINVSKLLMPPPPSKPPPNPPSGYYRRQSYDSNSSSNDSCEKDVALLNRCFDDIEHFAMHLNDAEETLKQLEFRRRSSKKKNFGDGMLKMRAKPPSEQEFVDIFQKFKFAFNLLGKVKDHIKEPNAPELVHFVFTPLAATVTASSHWYPSLNIPNRVVVPLLTAEAIELLKNCTSSKENELWKSLGDTWLLRSDQWHETLPTFYPVFFGDWSSNNSFFKHSSSVGHHPSKWKKEIVPDHKEKQKEVPYSSNYGYHYKLGDSSDTSVYSVEQEEQIFEKEQQLFLCKLNSRKAKIVYVMHPRTANNHRELSVVRGELLEVIDSSRNWWKVQNYLNEIGYVPFTILKLKDEDSYVSSFLHNSQERKHDSTQKHNFSPLSSEWMQKDGKGKAEEFQYF